MSSELSIISQNKFFGLTESPEMEEAMLSVSGEEFQISDLIRVRLASGGTCKWQIPDGVGGVLFEDSIKGILVYHQKFGVLWGSDDPKPGTPPILITRDLRIAEQIGPIPDNMIDALEKCRIDERHFSWERCPFNEWGTGRNGIGKKCREQRILFILREQDIYPIVVTIQPSSLAAWRKFFLHLPAVAKVPYYRCVIELGLKQATSSNGQPFAEVAPKLAGIIDQKTGEIVKRRFYDTLEAGVAQRVVTQDIEVD